MKNKIVDMTRRRFEKTKSDAEKAKKEISENNSHVKHENPKHSVTTHPEVMKESKTLMVD